MTFTSGEFRRALGVFPTGVAIVTTRAASGLLQGLTVGSFNSVSLEPPLVLFSVARSAGSFSVWQSATSWGISVLGETQDGISSRFAQSGGAKWLGFEPISGTTGVPLVPGRIGALRMRAPRGIRRRRSCDFRWTGIGAQPVRRLDVGSAGLLFRSLLSNFFRSARSK